MLCAVEEEPKKLVRDDGSGERKRVEEKTEVYRIVSDPSIFKEFVFDDGELGDLHPRLVTDETRMSQSHWVEEELVHELWTQKNRMDALFDAKQGEIYYRIRDQQFPQDRRGSSKFANRAGDKLWQVHLAVEDTLFDPLPPGSCFFDICGGPGAFSQLLLDKFSELRAGYGVTLRVPMTSSNDYWYKSLENHNRFNILWGVDNQGDVYVPANLESCKDAVAKNFERVSVIVSDGGFKIQKLDGQHMENLQELFSGRIILSEFTLCLMLASEKSHFVVKLFDSFSHLTVSLIYIATLLFEEVYIVKPIKSRIVNSERYLAAKRRKADSPHLEFCTKLLQQVHANIYQFMQDHPNEHFSPNSVLPIEHMTRDTAFSECIISMNNELARKQTAALKQVMDATQTDFATYNKLEERRQRFHPR